MSNPDRKRQDEAKHFNDFLSSTQLRQFDEFDQAEAPDFQTRHKVGDGKSALGIELTRLYDDSTSLDMKTSGTQSTTCALAQKIASNHESSGLRVFVNFRPHVKLKPREHAKKLAELVQEHAATLKRNERTTIFSDSDNDIYVSLNIWRSDQNQKARWQARVAGHSPRLTSEMIQRCLDKKNKKHAEYTSRAASNWLIIIATGEELPSFFGDTPKSVFEEPYKTSFDRVFYFDSFHKRDHELLHLSAESQNT